MAADRKGDQGSKQEIAKGMAEAGKNEVGKAGDATSMNQLKSGGAIRHLNMGDTHLPGKTPPQIPPAADTLHHPAISPVMQDGCLGLDSRRTPLPIEGERRARSSQSRAMSLSTRSRRRAPAAPECQLPPVSA